MGIRVTERARGQLHTGILYKAEDESIRVLHFCWNNDGRDQPAAPIYHWVALGVRLSVKKSLAAFCRLVAACDALADVAWCFRYNPALVFERGTGRLLGPGGEGLTCATFVLAMFKSIGVSLVDLDSWEPRPCDVWWQEHILPRTTTAHAELLRAQLGSIRYRPEEVAAAARLKMQELPAQFASVLPGARDVLTRLGVGFISCWHDPNIVAPPP